MLWPHQRKLLEDRLCTSRSPQVKKVVENVLRDKPDAGWGPNAIFRFPQEGGTGGIWKRVAALLPPERMALGKRVIKVTHGWLLVQILGAGEGCGQ